VGHFAPNGLIRGKEMCFCSQLQVCSKPLVRKLSAGSGSGASFATTVVPPDFLDRTGTDEIHSGLRTVSDIHIGEDYEALRRGRFVTDRRAMTRISATCTKVAIWSARWSGLKARW
jgi:hypothetical protein